MRPDWARTTSPCNALHSTSAKRYRRGPVGAEGDNQRVKGGAQGGRGFLAGEADLRRQDEHRLVDHRPRAGEVEIGGADVAQNVGSAGDVRRRRLQARRQVFEPPRRHGRHDVGLALEVAVEDRLAVADQLGEPARGDGLPALGFGQLARRRQNEFVALGALALFAFGDRHAKFHITARIRVNARFSLTQNSSIARITADDRRL